MVWILVVFKVIQTALSSSAGSCWIKGLKKVLGQKANQDPLNYMKKEEGLSFDLREAGFFTKRIPVSCSRRLSLLCPGLSAVSSFSPIKIELAPAQKQRNCSARLIFVLPALKRIKAFGIRIRQTAITRAVTKADTGFCFSKGEPLIGIKLLMVTLSGWIFSSCWIKEIRSFWLSPIPRIPPVQTDRPAFRTFCRVLIRSL